MELVEELDGVGQHLLVVDKLKRAEPVGGVAAQPQVFHDASKGDGKQFLVNHGNAGTERLLGIEK